MEANGEAMKPKTKSVKRARREWPADKAIPRFSNPEAGPVGFSARQAKARAHVYRIRFDDAEMSALQSMADRRGVSASVIIRELVRAQWSRLAGREADHPKR